MKVTMRVGLIHEGTVHVEAKQEIEMANNASPSEIMAQLREWSGARVHMSYDITLDEEEEE